MAEQLLDSLDGYTPPAQPHGERMSKRVEGELGRPLGIHESGFYEPAFGHVLKGPLPNPPAFSGNEERGGWFHGFTLAPLVGDESFKDFGNMGVEEYLPGFATLGGFSPHDQVIPDHHSIKNVRHVEEANLLAPQASVQDKLDNRKVAGCGLGITKFLKEGSLFIFQKVFHLIPRLPGPPFSGPPR